MGPSAGPCVDRQLTAFQDRPEEHLLVLHVSQSLIFRCGTLQQPAGVGPSLLAVILFVKGLMSFQDGGDSIEQTINLLNLQYLLCFKDATYLHLFLNALWPLH